MSKQEEPLVIMTDFTPQYNVTFWDGKRQVGKLWWDDGVMEFEGDVKESAERFFDFLKPYMNEYIRGKLND